MLVYRTLRDSWPHGQRYLSTVVVSRDVPVLVEIVRKLRLEGQSMTLLHRRRCPTLHGLRGDQCATQHAPSREKDVCLALLAHDRSQIRLPRLHIVSAQIDMDG
jgi:hypothetical protein